MRITVKVIPGASKDQIIKIDESNFKIKTTKPPENGKANEAIIEILSDYFKIKKSQITILSGQTSSRKIICIDTSS